MPASTQYTPNALIFADDAQTELLTAGHVSEPAVLRGNMLRVQDRDGRVEWYPITTVRIAPASPAEDRQRNAAQGAI